MGRVRGAEVLEAAVVDLLALGSRGRGFAIRRAGGQAVEIEVPGQPTQHRRVFAYDTVDAARAHTLLRAGGDPAAVVANRITGEAAALLTSSGWTWMDRRGEAHISDPKGGRDVLFLDGALAAESTPASFGPAPGGPIRGKAGVALAASLLLDPAGRPSLRSVARSVGMSPQAVSDAAQLLRQGALVDADGRAVVPDLFWALAAAWGPVRVTPVAEVPRWGEGPFLEVPDGTPGWVLAGDEAASALGAPLFAARPLPVLWAPDLASLRRGARWCGAPGPQPAAANLVLPPTPLACVAGPDITAGFPLPRALFAALDLATDPGRGREVLAAWTEPEASRAWT